MPDRHEDEEVTATAADRGVTAPTIATPPRRSRAAELRQAVGVIIRVRWMGVLFGFVQIATYYIPHPPGALPAAIACVSTLAVGNAALWVAHRRLGAAPDGPDAQRRATALAISGIVLDVAVTTGVVVVYTFDPDTAAWALLYVLPLEAALLFQLRGALLTMLVAAVLYTGREVYGQIVHDIPFLVVSISFRMGIGLIVAWVAGAIASNLRAERDELAAATERLAARSRELAEANRQLRAAREVQDEFIAITNHELRTPLTAILGYTTTLERRWDALTDDARRRSVEMVALQSRRLHELVDDVLTVSAASAGVLDVRPQPLELAPVVAEAVEVADLDVEVDCPAGVWVHADPKRLNQVLVNLLSNARKYGSAPWRLSAAADGGHVTLVVADHGPGVPPEFVPHLFERFTQASRGASRVAEGSGLGLAIVKDLVHAQGGTVWYEPGSPTGARFCLRLRRTAPVSTVPPPPAATQEA